MTNQVKAFMEAKKAADEAIEKLQRLAKELEEALEPKPRVIFNEQRLFGRIEERFLSYTDEISKYYKYSDDYIEFSVNGCDFRYMKIGDSNNWVYPKKDKLMCTLITDNDDVFEIFDYSNRKWMKVDYIERIELLEGVKDYDKNRKP